MVYKATVTSALGEKQYHGLCETDFKARYNNHTHSFNNIKKKTATELSKYVWKLKADKIKHNISWGITARAAAYKCGARICDLCLTEKYIIATADQRKILNKREGLVSKCRHRNKFYLKNVK